MWVDFLLDALPSPEVLICEALDEPLVENGPGTLKAVFIDSDGFAAGELRCRGFDESIEKDF